VSSTIIRRSELQEQYRNVDKDVNITNRDKGKPQLTDSELLPAIKLLSAVQKAS
jgi:hypothetical protein